MSRNLGRQNHRTQQSDVHAQLDNEITDVKSRIGSSAQETKDLKEKLKGLSDKKKEMGQSPRHSQAPSNRYNFPIPQIRPQALPLSLNDSASESLSSINYNVDISVSGSSPAVWLADSMHDKISQLQYLADASTGNTQTPSHHDKAFNMEIDSPLDMNGSASTNFDGHAFETPPFDLDAFNAALEDGPIPQLTVEEIQAHHFLRALLRK